MDSSTQERSHQNNKGLSGHLGTTSIVFMVVAAAAPLTVIGGNVPLGIAGGNGAGAPVGFIIAALVLLVFSIGFVTMTPHVKRSGAFYAYVRQSLGNRLGMGTAFVALVAYTAIQAGIYGYMGGAISIFVQSFGGPTLPWWLYSGVVLLIVATLGYRHIELSSKVLGVALVLEIGVVLIMDAAILFAGGAEGITGAAFTPSEVFSGPIGVAILFALTGFIGFESTAIYRDEARDPGRTIPRATFLAVIIIGGFYALSSWALVVGWGPSQVVAQATAEPATFMLDAAEIYAGVGVRHVMDVLLLTSLFACVLAFHNVIARYQFNLARDGALPQKLGTVHPTQGSPSTSSLVQSVTAAAIIAVFSLFDVDPLVHVFGSMAGVATVGMMFLLIFTSIAVVKFFSSHPDIAAGRPWSTRIAPIIATVVLLGCMYLVLSNFVLVTSSPVGVSILLATVPPVAFLIGMVMAPRSEKNFAIREESSRL